MTKYYIRHILDVITEFHCSCAPTRISWDNGCSDGLNFTWTAGIARMDHPILYFATRFQALWVECEGKVVARGYLFKDLSFRRQLETQSLTTDDGVFCYQDGLHLPCPTGLTLVNYEAPGVEECLYGTTDEIQRAIYKDYQSVKHQVPVQNQLAIERSSRRDMDWELQLRKENMILA